MFFAWFGAAEATELADTLDRVRPSIVSVGVLNDLKQTGKNTLPVEYRGTGFVVGDGRQVITNFHVVPDPETLTEGRLLVVFVGRGEAATSRIARVEKTDQIHDLALLSISGTALKPMTLNSASTVREGQEVAFTGFPIGLALGMYPSTNKGIVSAITPVVMPAVSARALTAAQIRRMRTPFTVYQLDAIAYPGNSGSPVYDIATGDVVAIVNSVFIKETKEGVLTAPSAITYAIPVQFAEALLNQ